MSSLITTHSSTAGLAPTTAQLAVGQFGINTHDGLLYFVQNSGTATVVAVGTIPPSAGAFTTNTTIALSGDLNGSTTFNGSSNVTIPTTLANSGVTAGTYNIVSVTAKGLVNSGSFTTYPSGTFVSTIGNTALTGTLICNAPLIANGFSGVLSQAMLVTGSFSSSNITASAANSTSGASLIVQANANTTAGSSINLNANSALIGVTAVQYMTNSVMRWQMGTDGSNSANFQLTSFYDNGITNLSDLTISRANTLITMQNLLSTNVSVSSLILPNSISITGDVIGSASFSGNNISIPVTPNPISTFGTFNTFNVEVTGQIQSTFSGNYDTTALTGNTTFYVNNTTGNDSSDGLTTGTAFQTLQGAWNNIISGYDMAGYSITVQCANGTYAPAIFSNMPLGYGTGNTFTLVGNTTSVSSCVINGASASCVTAWNNASIQIKGFKLTGNYHGLLAYTGGMITVLPVTNSTTTSMIFGAFGSSYHHMIAYVGGFIYVVGVAYTISGGGFAHMTSEYNSSVLVNSCNVTLTGTPTFSYFVIAQLNSSVAVAGSTTFTGSCTTTLNRYYGDYLGVIYTGGQSTTYFPGSTSGVLNRGSVYF